MEEYKLTSAKKITVTAYKAVGVKENGTLRPATAAEGSNCLGWALTCGEYTFIDDPATNNIDEGMVTRVGLKAGKIAADSIIVFRATVIAGESRNQDKLQMDELIYGKETYFSDIVRKVLNDTNNKSSMPGHSNWAAATNASARPQTTRIKIFAWLKPDGQVELKLPSKLQNWTGD